MSTFMICIINIFHRNRLLLPDTLTRHTDLREWHHSCKCTCTIHIRHLRCAIQRTARSKLGHCTDEPQWDCRQWHTCSSSFRQTASLYFGVPTPNPLVLLSATSC